jgi:hypothetical protein
MFIRRTFAVFHELWSEATSLIEADAIWVIDWRWLANDDTEEPSFISECALIHCGDGEG